MWNSYRSSPPEVFLEKGCLKICSKFTGEHPCRIVISIELLCYFIQVALRHGCSHLNLLHIFRTYFSKNTYRGLLLQLRRFTKYNIQQVYYATLVLASCRYCGDNVDFFQNNADFFQNTFFKESINMAVSKTSKQRQTFMKNNVVQL